MSPSSLGWSDFLREKILDKGHVVLLTVDAFSLGAGPQRVWEDIYKKKIFLFLKVSGDFENENWRAGAPQNLPICWN